MTFPKTRSASATSRRWWIAQLQPIGNVRDDVPGPGSGTCCKGRRANDRPIRAGVSDQRFLPILVGIAVAREKRKAAKLRVHLATLPSRHACAGRYTAVVIGAGRTGSEIAAELPDRLARVAGDRVQVRVILMDRTPRIADAMGWCGGMCANPLLAQIPLPHAAFDAFGRVPVDDCMRVKGVPDVYAAGDAASWLAAAPIEVCCRGHPR